MAGEATDSLKLLFLDRDEPSPFFSSPAIRSKPLENHSVPRRVKASQPRIVNRATSAGSSNSSGTSSTNTDGGFSRKSSTTSSAASSISVPPWRPPPTFVQQFMAGPHNYGYDLPCEFSFAGCSVRFHALDVEYWIAHSVSHFAKASLPSKAVCSFCDDEFESQGDDSANWHRRMMHIAGHFENLENPENMRPDFWVIEHLGKYSPDLISVEDHTHAMNYSERPPLDHTYPLGYIPPELERKKMERESQQIYNPRCEARRRKDEGKERSAHRSSRSHRS